MAKKAVIYARVSTDEQAKGYSLSTQIDACQKYASERGYQVSAVFEDDYTGASMDRPGLNALREHLENHPIQVVIVYDIDRLARKVVYQLLLEEDFKRLGALMEYVIGQYEDTDEGRLHKNISATIAEYEKAKILFRGKDGKKTKAKSGFVIVAARPPYGYKVKSEPHKSWLVIHEPEAKIVRLVFDTYVGEGHPSINKVAELLTEMNVSTRGDTNNKVVAKKHGYAYWSPGMIRHILTNETYIGKWHYGKTRMIDDGVPRVSKSKRGQGKQIARERSEWIPVDVPAIIDAEIFEAAKERLQLNKVNARRNKKYDYLLSGRLSCTRCGYTYIGHTRRPGQSYYDCNGKRRYGTGFCSARAFRADDTDAVVWTWLSEVISQPEVVIEGLEAVQADKRHEHRALYDRLDIIGDQIAETTRQLDKLLDLYLSGPMTKEELTESKMHLEDTLLKLEREHTDLESHLQNTTLTPEQIGTIEEFCSSIRAGLETATYEDKRGIIELLDVRGKMAEEEDGKVIYLRCLLGQQRLSVAPTSPLSSSHYCAWAITARLVLTQPEPPKHQLINAVLERVK